MDKKNNIWFISDILFGDSYQYPPDEESDKFRMNNSHEQLLIHWNDVVSKNDIVCLLGNIAINNLNYWYSRIQHLPGNKMLWLGEKDKNRLKWYYKFGFSDVVKFGKSTLLRYSLGNILISHIPMEESLLVKAGQTKFKGLANKHRREYDASSCILNIHGHTKGMTEETHRTFDASLKAWNPRLYLLDSIMEEVLNRDIK